MPEPAKSVLSARSVSRPFSAGPWYDLSVFSVASYMKLMPRTACSQSISMRIVLVWARSSSGRIRRNAVRSGFLKLIFLSLRSSFHSYDAEKTIYPHVKKKKIEFSFASNY